MTEAPMTTEEKVLTAFVTLALAVFFAICIVAITTVVAHLTGRL